MNDSDIAAKMIEAIGWCWSEACARTARGDNICKTEVPEILLRAQQDLPDLSLNCLAPDGGPTDTYFDRLRAK